MDPLALAQLFLTLVAAVMAAAAFFTAWRAPRFDPRGLEDKFVVIIANLERLERTIKEDGARQREAEAEHGRALRAEIMLALKALGEDLRQQSGQGAEVQRQALDAFGQRLNHFADLTQQRLAEVARAQAEATGTLRDALERSLTTLRTENAAKLDEMRQTVDEKLQGTLEKRLGESFRIVSERLELVHRGLGEMQSLASGVGDLKKVLTNVKTRGTWGEVQLVNLLDQVFAPDQYYREWPTRPHSAERVEVAIRLPGRGDDEAEVLLPIDAKFPREDYERLVDAADRGDAEAVEAAARALETRIKNAARDIRDKYIAPPHTTDFAFLFLPTEGLYAEVLRRPGLLDTIQRDFRVTVAGPTTLHALLNSLQMGFRTLAIQKRSSEVWQVLGAVKTEFGKYSEILDKVKKKLQEATNTVDDAARRGRAVDRKLKFVDSLPDPSAQAILGLAGPPGTAGEDEEG